MEEKQTAVDFLFEMWLQDKTITKSTLEQAKALEEKQINKAVDDVVDCFFKMMREQ